MRITLTSNLTFLPGITAKAGEVLVFTAPNTLELHKADGVTVTPIDLTQAGNVGMLMSTMQPGDAEAASYTLTKALKFKDAGIDAAIGDFLSVNGLGKVTISHAGTQVGIVEMTKSQIDWLVFIGTLTPLP